MDYSGANYEPWFRHVRTRRSRCKRDGPILDIPNDEDAEEVVQSAIVYQIGYDAAHPGVLTASNRDAYMYRKLDYLVVDYWRRRRGAELPPDWPDGPSPPPWPELYDRLRRALERARGRMSEVEQIAVSAWWKCQGDHGNAEKAFRAKQRKSRDYNGCRHRGVKKIKETLIQEFGRDYPELEECYREDELNEHMLLDLLRDIQQRIEIRDVCDLFTDVFCPEERSIP